ncbi:glycosyltransferase [Actinomadura sp. CNU-125]|uniref:glycosyltransferase n=1 Tax=Actinomadura sp. CNU-125 TaxID=1904961 RepID=UPI0011787020|nr:glycosyltransferase [Actinomadura sp. CNU-125]
MMPVPIICLTNGRPDCISKTIPSAIEHLTGVGDMVIVDDSGDPTYGQWLEDEFIGGPLNGKILHLGKARGYWAAMQAVWSLARHWTAFYGTTTFFFLEDDFVFNQPVDLEELAGVLNDRPYLTQVALVRQPWFGNEVEHGGLIEALEAQGQDFTEVTDNGRTWIEHRACFTGNPSVIPARTYDHDWPSGDWSESRFGQELFRDPRTRGAYWGARSDPPRVEHIGHTRVGAGY